MPRSRRHIQGPQSYKKIASLNHQPPRKPQMPILDALQQPVSSGPSQQQIQAAQAMQTVSQFYLNMIPLLLQRHPESPSKEAAEEAWRLTVAAFRHLGLTLKEEAPATP